MQSLAEPIATVFGLAGTALLYKPHRWAGLGFACWLISNPLVMYVMWINGHRWLFVQAAVYWVIAMASTWNWLVKPWLLTRRRL